MAGGRLSLEDRQSIAAGIAEGIAYAEIARRIGRPTSTVSREVARNGHRDYTADRAQRATRRRGLDRDSAPRTDTLADRTDAFVDELASLIAATGMPRMASRVFATLITSSNSTLTAAELVRGLGVSPASVSKAIGYLEGMELVERRPEPGSRRERYWVGDDVWTRAMRADSSGHARVADAAQRGLALFGADTPAGIRLARMGRFFGDLTEQLRGIDLADSAIDDTLTVIAALGHARRPVTVHRLASALGWPASRLDHAIRHLQQRPTLADPFSVCESVAGYELQPRPDRLSREQGDALRTPALQTTEG
ncbi:MarR family transcriptional regulator [Agromyces bauzanensis]